MIIGTAGHVDHGKTSLVKALTGVDTDRLGEEKARGISIELGFAHLPLSDGHSLGFIDVPGHERFVRTMLAGASGIDFFLLVIAADDGVMQQTYEHLEILRFLGVLEGIIALTKIDLVDESRQAAVCADVATVMGEAGFGAVEVFPVSCVAGTGLGPLKARIEDEALSRPRVMREGPFRLAIDRSFTLPGAGTIVTGTIQTGSIAIADPVLILPAQKEARVRALHIHGKPAQRGQAGERCALNLAAPWLTQDAVGRGDWLAAPGHGHQTSRFDARIRLGARERTALKTWAPVFLHLGTSALPARVVLLSGDTLAPGAQALVQCVLPDPVPARYGDAIVLRDIGASRTIGGGVVIDPRAPARGRRTPSRLQALAAMGEADPSDALQALVDVAPYLIDAAAFGKDRGLLDAARDLLIESCGLIKIPTPEGVFLTSNAATDALAEAVGSALGTFHGAHPQLRGMPATRLRAAVAGRLPARLFAIALQGLANAGLIIVEADNVRLPAHNPSLSAADTALWDQVLPLIEAERYRPPSAREIGLTIGKPVADVRKLCKALARMGSLIEVGTDRFFLKDALVELGVIAQKLAASRVERTFTAGQFKDEAGCGRNTAIQILEFLDREGITVRSGDVRRVVKPASHLLLRR